MKNRINTVLLGGFFATLVACGGGATPTPTTPSKPGATPGTPTEEVSKDAQAKFNAALDAFVEHDKANNWGRRGLRLRRQDVR